MSDIAERLEKAAADAEARYAATLAAIDLALEAERIRQQKREAWSARRRSLEAASRILPEGGI